MLTVHKNPCSSCPYRRDTPSGVWSREEYEKLRGYDDNQNLGTFLCHQTLVASEEIACKGWLMVHQDSVACRLAVARGQVDPATAFEEPSVALYGSGAEAADAGEKYLNKPKRKARRMMRQLFGTGRFKC